MIYLLIRQRKLCDGSTDSTTETICGRPLGLKFNPTTCELYVADAYFGLLKIGPNGGYPQQLANSAEGVPFCFLNALDIDNETGMVYFTDTSTIFQRRYYYIHNKLIISFEFLCLLQGNKDIST